MAAFGDGFSSWNAEEIASEYRETILVYFKVAQVDFYFSISHWRWYNPKFALEVLAEAILVRVAVPSEEARQQIYGNVVAAMVITAD